MKSSLNLAYSTDKIDKQLRNESRIFNFLTEICSFENFEITPIKGDASPRSYYRIFNDGKSYILMDSELEQSSFIPFINIDKIILENKLSAPRIIFKDEKDYLLLLEDFGQLSVTKYLLLNPNEERRIYDLITDNLIQMVNFKGDLKLPEYNDSLLFKELGVFTEWFLKNKCNDSLFKIAEEELFEEFSKLFSHLKRQKSVFCHRDFMADNLMFIEDKEGIESIGIIDFQDAVLGCPAYDLVSLLEDARRNISPDIAKDCKSKFVSNCFSQDSELFNLNYSILSLQRNLKIVGVFHRLNSRDGKKHYLNYLPRVWGYINDQLKNPLMYPILNWFERYEIERTHEQ